MLRPLSTPGPMVSSHPFLTTNSPDPEIFSSRSRIDGRADRQREQRKRQASGLGDAQDLESSSPSQRSRHEPSSNHSSHDHDSGGAAAGEPRVPVPGFSPQDHHALRILGRAPQSRRIRPVVRTGRLAYPPVRDGPGRVCGLRRERRVLLRR